MRSTHVGTRQRGTARRLRRPCTLPARFWIGQSLPRDNLVSTGHATRHEWSSVVGESAGTARHPTPHLADRLSTALVSAGRGPASGPRGERGPPPREHEVVRSRYSGRDVRAMRRERGVVGSGDFRARVQPM